MKGLYNQQGRRSGGYRKSQIKTAWNENVVTCSGCGIEWAKNGEQCPICYKRIHLSLPCKESRHQDCDGYLTFMPQKKINECTCACHK